MEHPDFKVHPKDDSTENVLKDNVEDLKLIKSTRSEKSIKFDEYLKIKANYETRK